MNCFLFPYMYQTLAAQMVPKPTPQRKKTAVAEEEKDEEDSTVTEEYDSSEEEEAEEEMEGVQEGEDENSEEEMRDDDGVDGTSEGVLVIEDDKESEEEDIPDDQGEVESAPVPSGMDCATVLDPPAALKPPCPSKSSTAEPAKPDDAEIAQRREASYIGTAFGQH